MRIPRRGSTAFVSLMAVIMLACAVPANAGGQAPLGYQLMCLKAPQECKGGGKAKITVTTDVMATLKRVNSHVNRTIKPRYDAAGADVWSASATSGDCEDYVLAKRRALIKAGIPSSSLRIAYVKTRKGEGHAILVVKTNGKDLVLDNLTATIKPLSQSGYRILSMSGANPLNWS
ncbi:transglutaminase-like cysteine peptidase [Devosia sp. CN2-171]|jgi:predicted transglutaminase-like cysteine proteinase|uniref:transglutaminase-like cysteine peptidase n=1 Tax=Devosia sp. CN2-171 TaxID=3400909 RepID=UPI003BF77EB4